MLRVCTRENLSDREGQTDSTHIPSVREFTANLYCTCLRFILYLYGILGKCRTDLR